jgi:hypothetical protein
MQGLVAGNCCHENGVDNTKMVFLNGFNLKIARQNCEHLVKWRIKIPP